MTRFQKILVGAGVVAVLGTIVALSLRDRESAKGKEVYLAKAALRDLASSVSANGRIEARTRVNVQSSVIGEIVELPVKEGDAVRRGQLLVQIDPERYRSEVQQLEASLRVQRIAVEQQEASLENLRRTLRRNRELFAQQLVAPETLERSELDVLQAEIGVKGLQEQVAQAEATLAKARDELRKTTIVSPMDGVVTQLNAEKGEITLTGTMNNPGTVILVVSDMGEILAEVDVDENRVVQVRPGQTAGVVVDAIGEAHPYRGHVTEIAGTAVKRPGTEVQVFAVKVALEDRDEKLRPGMTARARIETERTEDAVVVPIQAVLLRPAREVDEVLAGRAGGKDKAAAKKEEAPGGQAALAAETAQARADAPAKPGLREGEKKTGGTLDKRREIVFKLVDGKAVLTPVRTGISDETGVIVLEGLAQGDTVVTGPYRAVKGLKDGDAIREKKEEEEEGEEDKGEVEVKVEES